MKPINSQVEGTKVRLRAGKEQLVSGESALEGWWAGVGTSWGEETGPGGARRLGIELLRSGTGFKVELVYQGLR